ncbi:nitrilase-related carbon-nitrogen hydrolase [Candidatus Regiella endosymbiont of Tuberolachnus salignus]|uniref:nitrilase-related carbon-nitrogen hydrolase n=1 Tax=Candidatus Regiella endosymbiont of Tuberolachnus salignus TaxID=3077956 RepID=UPI0030CB42DE
MITIALAQTNALMGKKEENLRHLEQLCFKAAQGQAKFICFPELATTGYSPDVLGTELWTLSELQGGVTDKLFSELAKKLDLTIICGFVERGEAAGKIYNSAGVWLPDNTGTWEGTFRKVHLAGDEKKWFSPGNHCPLFKTPTCRIGVMICHDAGFPELARLFVLKEAELIFVPSAWPLKSKDIWHINCASRALENGIHLIAVNRWGQEGDITLFGGSQLMGPRGQQLKLASEKGEALMFVDVDLDLQAKARLQVPYLRERRKDLYSLSESTAEKTNPPKINIICPCWPVNAGGCE